VPGLELDLAGENVLPHHPVSHEAVERVREGRRTVLLEEEVPDPGEGVAADDSREQPPEVSVAKAYRRKARPSEVPTKCSRRQVRLECSER
jgi:TPP-dependent pyruvate/acetoin dehydrogenase alpha subunit